MISEFSFLVFKINVVTKRIAVLDKKSDAMSDLDRKELLSLKSYQKSLIEMAIKKMVDVPYVTLAKTFFSDNEILYKKSRVRMENIATFVQLQSSTVQSIA